jgi:hypothetical protein
MLPAEPEPLPALDPAIVSEDDLLSMAVDDFIGQDPEARERLAWITAEQEILRQACESDIWTLILRVDELAVTRWAELSVTIARWAFVEGQKHPREAS